MRTDQPVRDVVNRVAVHKSTIANCVGYVDIIMRWNDRTDNKLAPYHQTRIVRHCQVATRIAIGLIIRNVRPLQRSGIAVDGRR